MIIELRAAGRGFCDRLRKVTFCIAVALARGIRRVEICETLNRWCPYSLLDLIEIQGLEAVRGTGSGASSDPFLNNYSCPTPSAARLWMQPDAFRSPEELLEAWQGAYRRLQPVAPVAERVARIGADRDCIGFHLRLTDKVMETISHHMIRTDELGRVEEMCLTALEARRRAGRRRVFLAADDGQAKARWADLLSQRGFEVLMHQAEFDPSRLRQTDGQDFAVDLFTLARCGVLVGTTTSGVIQAAAGIGGITDVYVATEQMLDRRMRFASRGPRYVVHRVLRKLPIVRRILRRLKKMLTR